MEFVWQNVVFAFFGGLGLFLFGLRFMSGALQEVAGDKMRTLLEQGTRSPVRGVFTGALVTALIQSSSATIVITVGLVNAQLLTLRQAIGVIMGANIGTTVTAYLIGLNIKEYALPILSVGVLLYLFTKNNRRKLIGQAIFGFGLIFFGLTIMGEGMKPLKDLTVFTNLMVNIENNALLGVLIGTIFTFIVQSSSATIGVLQELAFQGAVSYFQAIPILFGDNIGTTITALLAALGASVAARRAALTHLLFNVIGTIIFLPLLLMGIFEKVVVFTTNHLFLIMPGSPAGWQSLNIKLQIAQTHAVFNITNTLILLPFVAVLACTVSKLIPDTKGDKEEDQFKPKFIDINFLNNPSIALAQATRETLRMGQLARDAFHNAIEYFNTREKALAQKGEVLENIVDALEREITDYIVLASEKNLSRDDSSQAYIILQSLNEIERIADLAENFIRQADYATRHHVRFSSEAQSDLDNMIRITDETLALTIEILQKKDRVLANRIEQNEKILDQLQAEYRKSHIRRLNERICNGNNGAVFLDLLGNLERISDHCRNIAKYTMGEA